MQVGRAKEAHAVLLDVFNNVVPTPEQIRLTALAASSAGDVGDAYYYMSEFHIASGDLPLAGKGATGFGIRLLDRLVADHFERG